MTVAHKNLTGTDLHENKGAATASDNQVATVTSGATVWKKLTHVNLDTTGNPFGAQLLHLQDQESTTTSGGTFPSGTTIGRTLNTVLTNEISGASLAGNLITLPAGTFFIQASAPGYRVAAHILSLQNYTDSTMIMFGTSEYSNSSNDYAQTRSFLNGRFTLASSKQLYLGHVCSVTRLTDGLGKASNIGTNLYAEAMIWKVA